MIAASARSYSSYGTQMSYAAALREYNAGRPSETRRFLAEAAPLGPAAVSLAMDTGTARWNYVSNVLDIARLCF
jgi:hypothetical protein